MRTLGTLLLCALAFGCDDERSGGPGAPTMLRVVADAPATAPAGAALTEGPVIEVLDADGVPIPGATVTLSVSRGGGQAPATATTDENGRLLVPWVLGQAPVRNGLRVRVEGVDAGADFSLMAARETPLAPRQFGDVASFLHSEGIEGTTEDLAFANGEMVLGVGDGVLTMDAEGELTARPLTGDTFAQALGLAYDADGNLWVADVKGKALRRISTDGVVSTAITTDGEQDLLAPNYVAVGPNGQIYVTDPCLGEIIRYDPELEAITGIERFDLPTEGGPNGLAFAPNGTLYTVTENTGLLCQQLDTVELEANLAGVFQVEFGEGGFWSHTPVAEGLGIFGDGLTFDVEGNLYVVIDTQENLQIKESKVMVLPEGETALSDFIVADGADVIANLAFGQGLFGETTLYMALLQMDLVRGSRAGVVAAEVGIPGMPLLQ